MKAIATVINNNLASGMWHNLVETDPNVTLSCGTKLYIGLQYSDMPPSIPGQYWCRQPGGKGFITQVKTDDIIATGYEWAGPLSEPE